MAARTPAQLIADIATYLTTGYKSTSVADITATLTNLVDSSINTEETDTQSLSGSLVVPGIQPSWGSTLTVASGVLTPTSGYHEVEGEGSTSDEVTQILNDTWPVGTPLLLRMTASGHYITFKHGVSGLSCEGGADLQLVAKSQLAILRRTYDNYWTVNLLGQAFARGDYINLGDIPSTAAQGVCMSWNSYISQRNDDDSANCNLVTVDGSGNQGFGSTSAPKSGATFTNVQAPTTIRFYYNSAYQYSFTAAAGYPSVTNSVSWGTGSNVFTDIYATSGSVNTSDERMKQDVAPIDDELLDAWEFVEFRRYRWKDAVAKKGDGARIHHGWIAQEIANTLIAHGIEDPTRYGFLCFDKWEESEEDDPVAITKAEDGLHEARHKRNRIRTSGKRAKQRDIDEAEQAVVDAEKAVETAHATRTITPAGERWGLRYDQCLVVEAAYQRRELKRIKQRLDNLENPPPAKKEAA